MLVEAASAVDRLEQPFASQARSKKRAAATTKVSLDTLLIEGRRLESKIADSITEATLERTIEGASTLTVSVSDAERELLDSGIFVHEVKGQKRLAPLHLAIPGPRGAVHFLLAKLAKQEGTLTLTFEDREVAWLRRYNKPRKADRALTTRAEFIQSLVREPKEGRIKFWCPELHVHQSTRRPIRNHLDQPTVDRADRKKGFAKGAKLKIKGAKASKEQLRQAERALGVADSLNASKLACLALIVAGIGESSFTNVKNPHSKYSGVFQADPANIAPHDTEQQARCFLQGGKGFQGGGAMALAKSGKLSPGAIATKVEASGEPPSFYDAYRDEADAMLKAFGGGDATPATAEITVVKRFAFTRGTGGKKEDSWTAIQRLAEEVHWRAFMVEGWLYYVSEELLFRTEPIMSISEETPGVDWIDFDWDTGKRVGEATVRCRAGMWLADPGNVVVVDDGNSPTDDRWLVSNMSRGLRDPALEITLKRPMHEKLEPANETSSRTVRNKASNRTAISRSSAEDLKERCRVISDAGGSYSYGGGHGPPLKDLKGSQGLDCSSSVSLALSRAGLFHDSVAWVSGKFASSYGKPGKGKEVTIWANGGHVFIQGRGWRFDTGGPGGGHGPRLHEQTRPTAGFTPRHPEGL